MSRRKLLEYAVNIASVATATGVGIWGWNSSARKFDNCYYPANDPKRRGSGYCNPVAKIVSPSIEGSPDILIIVNDAWRKDHFNKLCSPRLWKLSKEGIVYNNFFVNAGFTRASVPSYLSGIIPKFFKGDKAYDSTGFRLLAKTPIPINGLGGEAIPNELLTFPQMLKKEGYRTILATQNQMLSHWNNFGNKQWDHIINLPLFSNDLGGKHLVKKAYKFLKKIKRRDGKHVPTLTYLHLVDSHEPYAQTSMNKKELKRQHEFFMTVKRKDLITREKLIPWMKEAYIKGVNYADKYISWAIDAIEDIDRGRRSIYTFIFSDHGEMFNELGEIWNIAHTGYVPEEIVRVPLIIRGTGLKSKVVEYPFQAIDIAPTILRLAGVAPSKSMNGESLLSENPNTNRMIISASPYETAIILSNKEKISISRIPLI